MRVRLKRLEGAEAEAAEAAAAEAAAKGGKGGKADPKKARRTASYMTQKLHTYPRARPPRMAASFVAHGCSLGHIRLQAAKPASGKATPTPPPAAEGEGEEGGEPPLPKVCQPGRSAACAAPRRGLPAPQGAPPPGRTPPGRTPPRTCLAAPGSSRCHGREVRPSATQPTASGARASRRDGHL